MAADEDSLADLSPVCGVDLSSITWQISAAQADGAVKTLAYSTEEDETVSYTVSVQTTAGIPIQNALTIGGGGRYSFFKVKTLSTGTVYLHLR